MGEARRKKLLAGGDVARLHAALKPFADVELPELEVGDCVWLYVGKPNPHAMPDPTHGSPDRYGHLKVSDFRRARKEMGR